MFISFKIPLFGAKIAVLVARYNAVRHAKDLRSILYTAIV